MKLPIQWLMDYLPDEVRGEKFEPALLKACERWDLAPAPEPGQTLGRLLTFAGFGCDAVSGSGLNAILELDVLSNRPDGQCVLGLAREVAAVLHVELRAPSLDISALERGEAAASLAKAAIEEPELCPRYTARIIRDVKFGPSPQWLRERLQWLGLQPRNNIVDVTNFICFELNQPLHAFDLNTLEGRQIVVRRARDKEPFTPLYGEIPPLTPETLVIADGKHARAIAGVLGGKGSEVTPETTDILLESAYFNPANTRRTVRRLKVMDGRGTDSSYRFERGIDLAAVERASARAARLIVETAGGSIAPGVIDAYPRPRGGRQLELRYGELNRVFGAHIPEAEARRALLAIGCKKDSESPERIVVSVPSWRHGDLEREIDLIEEVARLYGYNHVPETTAMAARVPERSAAETAASKLRELFTALGFFEVITDSLVDPRWAAPAVWTAEKPSALDKASVLREDHSALRNSLLASLLAVRRHNQDHRTGEARLFEIGKVFVSHGQGRDERPHEKPVLGIIDDRGFSALRDAVERIGAALEIDSAHLKFSVPPHTPEFLEEGRACRVKRVREMPGDERAEDAIGWLGTITPALQKAFELRKPVAMCELDLGALAALPTAPKKYRDLPVFPEIARDVALIVDEAVAWGEIESQAREYGRHDPLRDRNEPPHFLSAYRGKQIGAGKKSVAFSVVYRLPDRTLTDEEANAAHEKFKAALAAKFKATLRE